jgi:myo-inositol-1(or 4)-monophosphatase
MLQPDMNELETYLDTARQAALAAGAILKDGFGKKKSISYKGRIDVVTNVDIASEKAIIDIIRKRHPDHDIVTEETRFTLSGSPYRWVIDPIDGTVNFAHNFPFVSVSIGLEIDGVPSVGVVNNPIGNELFHAVKGGGAFLNGDPISVSETTDLEKSLLATGFGYDIRENPKNNLAEFGHLVKIAQGIRRPGSASLDCCYVAMGRFDGYWELSIHPWDIAAGIVIIREAGGKATTFDGKPLSPFDLQIVSSNGHIHDRLLKELAQAK